MSGGAAYLSCERADVCALDAASGRQLWRSTVGRDYAPVMPVVAGGTVLAGWSRPAFITALDASTGAVRWSSQIRGDGVDLKGPPLVAGGLVYQSTSDDLLHTLDSATGARRWTSTITLPSPPTLAGGVVYVGGSQGLRTNGGTLTALRPTTGEILWKRSTPSGDRLPVGSLPPGASRPGMATVG